MRTSVFKNTSVLVLALVGIASRSNANTIVTVPPGLSPGSPYRLVFVTADTYTAESSNIADYNNDVNTEANGVAALEALGATWLDIGSTEAVNAIDNVGIDSGVPIYDLGGDLIASDAGTEVGSGLFGFPYDILAPIQFNEDGGVMLGNVWTGSLDGRAYTGYALGDGDAIFGVSSVSTFGWMTNSADPYTTDMSLYGISGVLTVPESATPEPSSMGLAIGGMALMVIARHRRRRATNGLPAAGACDAGPWQSGVSCETLVCVTWGLVRLGCPGARQHNLRLHRRQPDLHGTLHRHLHDRRLRRIGRNERGIQ